MTQKAIRREELGGYWACEMYLSVHIRGVDTAFRRRLVDLILVIRGDIA